MRFEQIEFLMAQVGSVLEPIATRYFADEKLWTIGVDATLTLLVEYDGTTGKLFLTCELGEPAVGDRHRLYELMLSYNFFWHRTGGGRLSIDGPDGNVHFTFDVAASVLDAGKLAGVVMNVADVAREWRDVIRQPQDGKPALQMPVDATMIRI